MQITSAFRPLCPTKATSIFFLGRPSTEDCGDVSSSNAPIVCHYDKKR